MKLSIEFKTVSDIYPQNLSDLNNLYDRIQKLEDEFTEIPLFLKKALNGTLSLIQFIESNECNTSLAYRAPLAKLYKEFDEQYASYLEEVAEEQQLGYNDLVKTFERDLSFAEASKELKAILKDSAKVNFKKARAKLLGDMPNRNDKFKLVKHSVIPIVSRRLNIPKFRPFGVEIIEFEQYFIFQNQMLLAINTDMVQAYNSDKKKKDQITSQKMAQIILNDTYNTMTLFSEDGIRVKECPGFMFYWLMPTELTAKIQKLVGPIDDWGLNV